MSDGQKKGKGGWEALSVGVGVLLHIVRGRIPAEWLYHYFIAKKRKSVIEWREARGGKL